MDWRRKGIKIPAKARRGTLSCVRRSTLENTVASVFWICPRSEPTAGINLELNQRWKLAQNPIRRYWCWSRVWIYPPVGWIDQIITGWPGSAQSSMNGPDRFGLDQWLDELRSGSKLLDLHQWLRSAPHYVGSAKSSDGPDLSYSWWTAHNAPKIDLLVWTLIQVQFRSK